MTAVMGLLFDKDGTLFDFRATWGGWTRRVIEALAAGRADRAAEMGRVLGYDLASGDFAADSAVVAHTTAEIRDLLLPLLPPTDPEVLLGRMNDMAAENQMIEAVPLVPLFSRFRAMGLKIGLATNDAEAPAKAHLRQAAIDGHFDFVAGFDSGWGGKPAAGQMQAFLARTGLAPRAVAMVGDSLHDLDAGRAAGMRTVAVLTGIAPAEALAPHADVVLADIGELPRWIAAQ
ncbi:MAG: HAD family hydrolase [Proteobacteria bacterium]|nr:HAD family hydrolase [Pseudomonadota bacterium]MBS0572754.1 HAD family hydrolase [Pseudomonadota bacterium]